MSLWVNLSAYGRIRGCSSEAVKQAIKAGRLKNSVRQNQKGKWEVNPEVANLEWHLNTDHTRRFNAKNPDLIFRPEPTPAPFVRTDMQRPVEHPEDCMFPPISESRAKLEAFKAGLAQLEHDKEVGKLVDADAVKAEWFKIVTEAKTKFMALPAKVKANIPRLTVAEVSIVERLVLEALEDLSHANY